MTHDPAAGPERSAGPEDRPKPYSNDYRSPVLCRRGKCEKRSFLTCHPKPVCTRNRRRNFSALSDPPTTVGPGEIRFGPSFYLFRITRPDIRSTRYNSHSAGFRLFPNCRCSPSWGYDSKNARKIYGKILEAAEPPEKSNTSGHLKTP